MRDGIVEIEGCVVDVVNVPVRVGRHEIDRLPHLAELDLVETKESTAAACACIVADDGSIRVGKRRLELLARQEVPLHLRERVAAHRTVQADLVRSHRHPVDFRSRVHVRPI